MIKIDSWKRRTPRVYCNVLMSNSALAAGNIWLRCDRPLLLFGRLLSGINNQESFVGVSLSALSGPHELRPVWECFFVDI